MERLAGRIILLWGWRRLAVAFVAGAFLTLTQAPYDFFAVGFISFPVLVWLLDGVTADGSRNVLKRLIPAFATGWWFGFGYFLAGLWWIGGAVLVEAESFAWALPFAVVGIPILMAFFYAVAATVARLFWTSGVTRLAALAFGFGLAEWLRTFMLTGFPWNPIGFAAMPTPLLMQSVAVVGVTGMNALVVFVFSAPALLVGQQRRSGIGLALAALLVAVHAIFGLIMLNTPLPGPSSEVAARIVQPSIDLSEKWDEGVRDRIFSTMLELSSRPVAEGTPKPQLILWPETSVPFLFTERPDALATIGEMLKPGQMLIAGVVREEKSSATTLYYNSVIAIDDNGEIVDAVDKVHLVPFGEYIPFSGLAKRFGIEQLVAGPMNFEPGSQRPAIVVPGGMAAVPFICYEIIFPDMVSSDAESAGLVLNVTNDAWFGDTPGPYQHFRQAQIRAVENGIPLLRAANNGISGVIDARGRVVDALALNVRDSIDTQVAVSPSQGALVPWRARIGLLLTAFFGLLAVTGFMQEKFRAN
ncbi:MAG: apolipoprotein N-acyltransferase [Rhizobiaceae bacterium]|nr:apolipoprotein N-acyltransferase [Rhizobiaceae bacterium]